MTDTSFFARGEGLALRALCELSEGELTRPETGELRLTGIATLANATGADVAFFDNPRYRSELETSRAGCILVGRKHAHLVPEGIPTIVAADVHRAFGLIGQALYPEAAAPKPFVSGGVSDRAFVHPSAKLEEGVVVEPFATVGPGAEIGRGTVLSPGSVVGEGCRIGRDCRIGPQVSIQHALIGDRVILHPGVQIGQDGFGYAIGGRGILKMVQIGRVVIQDNVEIGANTTVDRGALRDTVIGENTKIDNQVQIAHNVTIGRNCIIVSQVGISGSATIGNGVAIGGQAGVNGHVTIGDGAQIAAISSVAGDVPAGARWGGTPAHDVREWFREVTWVRESAKAARKRTSKDDE